MLVCAGTCVCMFVCMYALRIVAMYKILCFINALIIIIISRTTMLKFMFSFKHLWSQCSVKCNTASQYLFSILVNAVWFECRI